MSGSEHARPARCIWLTEDEAIAVGDPVRAKWEAAPANPHECARSAIGQCNRYVTTLDEITVAVLRALGCAKDPA